MLLTFENQSSPGDEPADLQIAVPYLSPPALETLMPDLAPVGRHPDRLDLECGISIFYSQIPVSEPEIEESAYRYFCSLFSSLEGRYLYRNWTYVPRINAGGGDRENYRQYCSGRSLAYGECFSNNPIKAMAAGSCVGCSGDLMTIITITGNVRPHHFENPNQVPAYRYPREYGPRSPSFSRATTATIGEKRYRFISGTAAVLGHKSMGIGNVEEQLAITADNLETIERQTASGTVQSRSTRSVGKVYLRHAGDYATAKRYFENRFPDWSKNLIYLHSDICREDLLVEAELTFIDSLS